MAASLKINVILRSGKQALFEGITPGKSFRKADQGITLEIGAGSPSPVTVTPPGRQDPLKSVEYRLTTDMMNYHKVIVPESGRWYIGNNMLMVSFWRHKSDSAVNDFKMPLYIFTGQDLCAAMAFGVVGAMYETSFRTLEPTTNRALIAYMRRLTVQIKRGTDLYPIPDSVALARPDGAVTEHLYFITAADRPRTPWVMVLREFADHQKRLFDLPDVTTDNSIAPLWCSWTDWFSDDVTDQVILRSVREGVRLGIRNYIIDDGWFGPGLDNDYDVKLNIGDWDPDPAKIKDMPKLVKDIRALGGVPIIWCAPHAVAPDAQCFEQRKKFLIRDDAGQLLMTPNKFHSLCFMNPQARQIMADICAGFITRWDFDGAKYDLFNCLPLSRCTADHEHDGASMMEGLEKTLALIDTSCRRLKSDYIVELKQNYGTPFLARWGTMTRAGDTPYNTEGNFLRTLYVQAYSPYAVNDYQTITSQDSPEAAACIVLKMMAVGIPTYSIDFDRLCQANKDVIAHYNRFYLDHKETFKRFRIPLDGENNLLKIPDAGESLVFLVNDGGPLDLDGPTTVLNGTFKTDLFVRCAKRTAAGVASFDCYGRPAGATKVRLEGWKHLPMLPGGRLEIRW
jgi:hypothetical protein